MKVYILKQEQTPYKKGSIVFRCQDTDEWTHWLRPLCEEHIVEVEPEDEQYLEFISTEPLDYTINYTKKLGDQANTEITSLYNAMNVDIYNKLEEVFGTRSGDSALAYKMTWEDMVQNPSNYLHLDLSTDIAFAEFEIGDKLDSEAKIISYAKKKLEYASEYATFRLERIAQFRKERQEVLDKYGL